MVSVLSETSKDASRDRFHNDDRVRSARIRGLNSRPELKRGVQTKVQITNNTNRFLNNDPTMIGYCLNDTVIATIRSDSNGEVYLLCRFKYKINYIGELSL